jgi:histidinol-phosphate aminotransferase
VRLLAETDIFAEVRDTETNFVLARCRPAVPAGRVIAHLGLAGVDVKDCADVGLPAWLRVTVGSRRNLAALARGLATLREPVAVPALHQTGGPE